MLQWRDCVLPEELQQVRQLLKSHGLDFDEKATYTGGLFDNERLIASGSLSHHVIEMMVVHSDCQNDHYMVEVLTHLLARLREQNIQKFFLYSTPKYREIFLQNGFRVLVELSEIIMFENRYPSIEQRLQSLRDSCHFLPGSRAALVMNCNPLTNGHLYLIDTCAKQYDQVLLFLVEEDRSVFPYAVRYALLKEAVKTRPNVMVLPSTEYQISAATFPTYFLKEDSIRSRLQMELDVRIFQNYFMPIFSIQTRMAGTEPLDSFTAAYNQTMKAILGPSFLEIPRLIYQDQVVSASMVRHYAKVGDYNRIKASVPQVTYDYLISKEGKSLFHG